MSNKSEEISGISPAKKENAANIPFLPFSALDPSSLCQQALDYWIDAVQRSILFLDVLRQHGNWSLEPKKDEMLPALDFKFEMVLDGRNLIHPVNYYLLRILPPEGIVTDPKKRPFIVFDPRAGHGPGIGGMKENSEIGSSLRAGHPCYFVGFFADPVPGQTVEHVCEAEAIFISHVVKVYPQAEKPCLIGNCQAGWQIAMVGSVYTELVGVLILTGAPMSFWAGVRGKNPTRYVGGIVGGTWTVALASDLGNGRFDGAAIVDDFEKLNPSNTHWKKAYNLYARIDTEAPRFLEFERWWSSPILLDKNEIQFIVDALFMGNRFSTARLRTSDGLRIDMRNIKSPILVFCSQGDDITSPQQALGWITDLYRSDNEIIAAGQTIIYCLHETIGHLGIFVSGSVASKEHDKFIQNIDMIETLPPGLYEAVFYDKTEDTEHASLATGDHVLKFETRTLQDIKKIVNQSSEDNRCFLAAKRISENILGLYESYVSPWVCAFSSEQSAEFIRKLHPVRSRYEMFSDRNFLLASVGNLTETVKTNRRPVSQDNFFWKLQESASSNIIAVFDAYKDMRNFFTEKIFFGIYDSEFLQAAVGLRKSERYTKVVERDVDRERDILRRIQGLLELASVGGLREALIRGMLYVVRGGGGFDEREFNMLKQLCNASITLPKMSQAELRTLIRQQQEILVLDEKNAMEAIPELLDFATESAAQESLSAIHATIQAHGKFTAEERRRLQQLEPYFIASHKTPRRRATDAAGFNNRM
jgi:hypothetical protein